MDAGRTMFLSRMRRQDAFGLVELLIAMTVLVIGIMAVVAGFSAGALSLQRASKTSTAGTVADAQMEGYRALAYGSIKLDDVNSGTGQDTAIPTVAPYTTHSACGSAPSDCAASKQITGGSATACAAAPRTDPTCPSRITKGADGDSYRVDVYIKWTCALGDVPGGSITAPTCVGSRPAKLVTIVVRDAASPARALFRESSTFEQALG